MRGCNMAFQKEDLYKTNGYNEEMTARNTKKTNLHVDLFNSRTEKRII